MADGEFSSPQRDIKTFPETYTENADGTITGPGNGTLKDTGKVTATGRPILERDSNGQKLVVNADGKQQTVSVESDSQGANNQRKGQESEDKVAKNLSEDFESQVSFLNRERVSGSPEGSVRPDFCSISGNCSIEVKNYDLNRSGGQNALVKNITDQAKNRVQHLPDGMSQKIVIDLSGQNVSLSQQREIRRKIVNDSDGAIDPHNIDFLADE